MLFTIEEGSTGGFGASVLHHLAATGQLDHGLIIRTLTMPDRYLDQMAPAGMIAAAGLDANGIVNTVLQALGRIEAEPARA